MTTFATLRPIGRILWGSFSWVLTLVIVLGVATLFFRSQKWEHWILVRPPSLPAGIYMVSVTESLSVGIPTVVCIPGSGGALALSRSYVNASWMNTLWCAEGEAPMIKMLAALPGDHVHVERNRIQINDRPWLSVPMASEDTDGRPLKPMLGRFHLADDECYALSLWSDRSYDSRYFGAFPCPTESIQTALPVDTMMAQAIDSLGKQLRGHE